MLLLPEAVIHILRNYRHLGSLFIQPTSTSERFFSVNVVSVRRIVMICRQFYGAFPVGKREELCTPFPNVCVLTTVAAS